MVLMSNKNFLASIRSIKSTGKVHWANLQILSKISVGKCTGNASIKGCKKWSNKRPWNVCKSLRKESIKAKLLSKAAFKLFWAFCSVSSDKLSVSFSCLQWLKTDWRDELTLRKCDFFTIENSHNQVFPIKSVIWFMYLAKAKILPKFGRNLYQNTVFSRKN